MKSLDDYFTDWESHVFGYGYGTGEEHIIPALKAFVAAIPAEGNYDYKALEGAVGALPAWLLLNTFCHEDLFDYGSSPRFGWLSHDKGQALKAYIDSKSAEQLAEVLQRDYEMHCYPDVCNCAGEKCHNPFWRQLERPVHPRLRDPREEDQSH